MASKYEKLFGGAWQLQSAYTGFPFRGKRIADEKTRRRSAFPERKARVLDLWDKATDEERSMAQLLIINQSFDKLPLAIDGVELPVKQIDPQAGMAFLSSIQPWSTLSPEMADGVAQEIRQDLLRASLNMNNISEEDIIAAFPIETKLEVNAITQKLQNLSDGDETNNPLFKGLLRAVSKWTNNRAAAAMAPSELIKIRKDLGYTQADMVKAIGISLRQYIRYEMGRTRISDKMAKKIKAVT